MSAPSSPSPALTVRIPLSEEIDAIPCLVDEPHGPPPANIAPARALSRQPLLPLCEMCGTAYDPSERVDDLPFCGYECASGGGSRAEPQAQHDQCDHCGIHVREPGLCDRCLREFEEENRWLTETCCGCRLPNADCRCYEREEGDDYDRGDDTPPGRRCPVCGCNFEGNDWKGVCSRACARPRGWE